MYLVLTKQTISKTNAQTHESISAKGNDYVVEIWVANNVRSIASISWQTIRLAFVYEQHTN